MLTFAETQSNAAMEAAIGRRLLALIKPGVVDFAGGGGKKCTKGLSCGGSCISKAKVCIKAMNPAQKQEYRSIIKAVKAGGEGADKAMKDFKAGLKPEASDTEKGEIAAKSQLTVTAKVVEPSSETPQSAIDELNSKYASVNPSRADVDAWIDGRIAAQATAEQLAMSEALMNLGQSPGSLQDKENPEYIKAINDKESWARARQIKERETHQSRQAWTPEDFDMRGMTVDIAKEDKKLKNPNTTEAQKAKILKDRSENDRLNQETADRQNKMREAVLNDPNSRLEAARKQFDGIAASHEDNAAKIKASLDNGDLSVREKLAADVLATLPKNDKYELADTPTIGSALYRRRVKDYLKSLAIYSPAAQLGIKGAVTPASVKAAYKKAAVKAHPDRGGSAAKFEAVNQAYQKLKSKLDFSDSDDELIVYFQEYKAGSLG